MNYFGLSFSVSLRFFLHVNLSQRGCLPFNRSITNGVGFRLNGIFSFFFFIRDGCPVRWLFRCFETIARVYATDAIEEMYLRSFIL